MAMDLRRRLERDIDGLHVESIEPLGEGWDHAAFIVNGEYVFRVTWELVDSRDEPGADPGDEASALPEVALLRAVAGRLPLAVPEPVFVARDGRYFGYRFLPGPSLAELLERGERPPLDDAFVELVVDVAVSVAAAVPVEDAFGIGLRRANGDRIHEAAPRALASELLTPPMRDAATAAVAGWSARWAEAGGRPVATLHADLGLDHWLVDECGATYALIDWSDACVGPPELDLAALMWHAPELVAATAQRYAERTARQLDGDLVFACGYLNALEDLGELLGTASAADPDDIGWCVEFLDRWADPDLAGALRGVRFPTG
jgi:aminoglycoside phosphotransferase (APT) family kinase protein